MWCCRMSMPALSGAVYTLKFDRKKNRPSRETFKIMALPGRLPMQAGNPRTSGRESLLSPSRRTPSTCPEGARGRSPLGSWEYGPCAVLLHLGPYSEEAPNIERLHKFIVDSGYVFNGVHEEWYLTRPTAKVQKTLLLHPVRKTTDERRT